MGQSKSQFMDEREQEELLALFDKTPHSATTPFKAIDNGFFEIQGYHYSREFVAVKGKKAASVFASVNGDDVKIEVCDTDVFVVGKDKTVYPITESKYLEVFGQAIKLLSL